MEGGLEENGCIYMRGWDLLLFTWNYHSIVCFFFLNVCLFWLCCCEPAFSSGNEWGYSLLRCWASRYRDPLISVRRLWSAGSAAALRELSRSGPAAYPRVGKEPRPLRWLGDSQPPGHPGPLHAARCLYADASAGNWLFSSVGHAVCLSATPGTPARQASLSGINSRSSLKPMSIESVTPSNHVTLCRPLPLPPSVFPSTRSFQMSRLFASGGQSTGVSASASVLPVDTQDWSPLAWTGTAVYNKKLLC